MYGDGPSDLALPKQGLRRIPTLLPGRRPQLGEAEVDDHDASVLGHHDVARFEVSMHDTLLVGRREAHR